MNVTVYGDSILKGVLLEQGKYVVDRSWEQALSERYGLSIRNRSRFGCTIGKALEVIRRDCRLEPDRQEIAVLELGGNDCDYHWEDIAEDPAGEFESKTPPEEFTRQYREAVELLRRSGRTPVILNLPPIHSGRYLDFICRNGLNRENILRWLGDLEAISRWQRMYSDLAEQTARDTRTPLLEVRSAFPPRGEALAELLCLDGIHPSRSGRDRLFRRLCRYA